MNALRWHRLSTLWKSWIFNQEPAEEQNQIPESSNHVEDPCKTEGVTAKDGSTEHPNVETLNQNSEYLRQKSETDVQDVEYTDHKAQTVELLQRSCSEPCPPVSATVDWSSPCPRIIQNCGRKSHRSCHSEGSVDCVLQVDNGSEGNDSFLQREGSQRQSRRRFRRVNPRGERELIIDGQEPTGYSTVREKPLNTKRSLKDPLVE